MVDLIRPHRLPRPTDCFDYDAFDAGLAGLTANDGFREPLSIPPEWRGKLGDLGPFGPIHGAHLYPGDPSASEQAFILAGHVDAADLRYSLNIYGSSVFGLPERTDIRSVRGVAFMTAYRPVPPFGEGLADPHRYTAWVSDHHRFLDAGLRPNYILDYVRSRCWAILPFEKPDFVHGDEQRAKRYDDIVRDIADAAGGVAAADPLRTTVPMPGACLMRQVDQYSPVFSAPTIFLGGAELYGSSEPHGHGARLEDLAGVAARLRATPRFDAVA